jgi:hypothetical protein
MSIVAVRAQRILLLAVSLSMATSFIRFISFVSAIAVAQTLVAATPPEEVLQKRVRTPVEVEYPPFTLFFDGEMMEHKQLWDRGEFDQFDALKKAAAERYVAWIKLLHPNTKVRVGRSGSPDYPDGDVFQITPRDWLAVATGEGEFNRKTWEWAMDCDAYHELTRALDRYQKVTASTPNATVVDGLPAIKRIESRRAKEGDMELARAVLSVL